MSSLCWRLNIIRVIPTVQICNINAWLLNRGVHLFSGPIHSFFSPQCIKVQHVFSFCCFPTVGFHTSAKEVCSTPTYLVAATFKGSWRGCMYCTSSPPTQTQTNLQISTAEPNGSDIGRGPITSLSRLREACAVLPSLNVRYATSSVHTHGRSEWQTWDVVHFLIFHRWSCGQDPLEHQSSIFQSSSWLTFLLEVILKVGSFAVTRF